MKPLLSVLIANYNNGHFFKDAFESLLAQTEQNWEAVIIDDASTDNSVEVIQALIAGDSRFRFYENEVNLGYQKTIIRAIELSEADIFGRLDPDDTLAPEAVELSLKAHHEHPEAGLVYSDINICDENLNLMWLHNSVAVLQLNEAYYNLSGEISPFATFKMSVYNLTTGIDPYIRRAEDKDIYMKMCEVAPAVYVPVALYTQRLVTGSLSSYANEEKAAFWHWVALVKMMDRRNTNLEDIFPNHFVDRKILKLHIQHSENRNKWAKKPFVPRFVTKTLQKVFTQTHD